MLRLHIFSFVLYHVSVINSLSLSPLTFHIQYLFLSLSNLLNLGEPIPSYEVSYYYAYTLTYVVAKREYCYQWLIAFLENTRTTTSQDKRINFPWSEYTRIHIITRCLRVMVMRVITASLSSFRCLRRWYRLHSYCIYPQPHLTRSDSNQLLGSTATIPRTMKKGLKLRPNIIIRCIGRVKYRISISSSQGLVIFSIHIKHHHQPHHEIKGCSAEAVDEWMNGGIYPPTQFPLLSLIM